LFRLLVVLVFPLSLLVLNSLSRRRGGSLVFLSFVSTFPVFLVWITNYLGVTFFRSEHEDKAFEYWLTFPHRPFRKLAGKAAARLIMVLLFSAIYTTIYFIGSQRAGSRFSADNVILKPFFICPLAVLIFINSGLCGFLESRNLRALFNVATFFSWLAISMGISRLTLPILRDMPVTSLVVNTFAGLLLVILLSAGSLYATARKLDLRSPARYAKIIQTFNLPVLLGMDILALLLRFGGGQR
ncbi:MAG: hypothetical protein OEW05_03135, partial [Candidatus Aminicenantes bacterium]|nr:hypothetical protein [Candidatus Aminicenantes bacterium]